MIFLAVAAPTPGRSSRSFSLALFRSTFAFVPLACPPELELASALTANANAAIVKNIATILKVLFTVPPELPSGCPQRFTLLGMKLIETTRV